MILRKSFFKAINLRRFLFVLFAIMLIFFALVVLKEPLQRYFLGVSDDVVFLESSLEGKLQHEVERYVKEAAIMHWRKPSDAILNPVTGEVTPGLSGYYIDHKKTVEKIMHAPVGTIVRPVYVEKKPVLTLNDYPVTSIYRGNPDKRQIALMINVAWGDEYIDDMLKVLANEEANATFFLVGKWAENNPGIAKLIKEKEHELGNHGYTDEVVMSELNSEEIADSINATNAIIERLVGTKPIYFTPHRGEYNQMTLEVVSRIGMRTVLWSIDTLDWRLPGVEVMKQKIIEKAHNGAIILMHPTAETVPFLAEVLPVLSGKGYEIVSIGELLSLSPFSSTGRLVAE